MDTAFDENVRKLENLFREKIIGENEFKSLYSELIESTGHRQEFINEQNKRAEQSDVWYNKAEDFLSNNFIDEALDSINKSIEIQSSAKKHELKKVISLRIQEGKQKQQAQESYKAGLEFIKGDDLLAAEEAFRKAITLDVGNKVYEDSLSEIIKQIQLAYFELANYAYLERRFADALTNVYVCLRYNPSDLEIKALENRIQENLDDQKKKRKAFRISLICAGLIILGLASYFFIDYQKDKTLWQEASQEKSFFAFKNYLNKFPNGYYFKDANDSINVYINADNNNWQTANSENSISSFLLYMKNGFQLESSNPDDIFISINDSNKVEKFNGKFFSDALSKLDSLYEANNIIANSKDVYRIYLKYFPNGKYFLSVKEKLDLLTAESLNASEDILIRQILSNYFDTYYERRYEEFITLFQPIVANYLGRKQVSKASILDQVRQENNTSVLSQRYIIDWNSFKAKKNVEGNFLIEVILDQFTETANSPQEEYANLKANFIFEKDLKIISFTRRILSYSSDAEILENDNTQNYFKIIAAQAHFSDEPNSYTVRQAYMVMGEKGIILKRSNGYIYTEFLNPSGKLTQGWIDEREVIIEESSFRQ